MFIYLFCFLVASLVLTE